MKFRDPMKFCRFVGYGKLGAELLALGIEEAAPNPNESDGTRALLANLVDRHDRFPETTWCKNAAHRELLGARCLEPGEVPVWSMLARLVTRYHRRPEHEWKEAYTLLGSDESDMFLGEILPVPRYQYRYWDNNYAALFGFQDNRSYINAMWPKRKDILLKTFLGTSRPRVVIAYGAPARSFASKLVSLTETQVAGQTRLLHPLGSFSFKGKTRPRIQVGRDELGTVWAFTGFMGGYAAGKMTLELVNPLVDMIHGLQNNA